MYYIYYEEFKNHSQVCRIFLSQTNDEDKAFDLAQKQAQQLFNSYVIFNRGKIFLENELNVDNSIKSYQVIILEKKLSVFDYWRGSDLVHICMYTLSSFVVKDILEADFLNNWLFGILVFFGFSVVLWIRKNYQIL